MEGMGPMLTGTWVVVNVSQRDDGWGAVICETDRTIRRLKGWQDRLSASRLWPLTVMALSFENRE
jgi:hypothetical protein